jgi:hypothetical protein
MLLMFSVMIWYFRLNVMIPKYWLCEEQKYLPNGEQKNCLQKLPFPCDELGTNGPGLNTPHARVNTC